MAQWLEALVAKADNLSLILRTHLVEGETTLVGCPLTPACAIVRVRVRARVCVCLHTHTQMK